MKGKRTFGLITRVAVSGALLAFLLSLLDLAALRDVASHANLYWIGLALTIFIVCRLIMGLRWQVILKYLGIDVPFGEITWITFVSSSLSSLVPGGLGADIFRGIQLVRKYGRLSEVTSSILIDRVIGIYATIVLATIGSVIAVALGIKPNFIVALIIFQIVVVGVWGFGFWLSRQAHRMKMPNVKLQKYWSGLIAVARSVTDVELLRRIFIGIFSNSIVTQVGRCLVFYCLYRALGVEMAVIYYVIFIPIVFLATQVPISISGLGIAEGMLIFLFEPLGVPREVSFAAGIMSYGIQIIFSLGVVVAWLAAGVANYIMREMEARRSS